MQSVIKLGIFLGWDGGGLNLKKKKKKNTVSFVYFHLIWHLLVI